MEIAAARHLQARREVAKGMEAYGIDVVSAELKRIPAQIAANAGFNPLEKMEEVIAEHAAKDSSSLAADCDNGCIADMRKLGVIDPTGVKLYAVGAAAEVAEAVLRINVVIRKREEPPSQDVSLGTSVGMG